VLSAVFVFHKQNGMTHAERFVCQSAVRRGTDGPWGGAKVVILPCDIAVSTLISVPLISLRFTLHFCLVVFYNKQK
jgi:hypothetical protein